MNKFKQFPRHWEVLPFTSAVRDATSGNIKIPKGEYLDIGEVPIVDQGKALFGGFTDNHKLICKSELPTIIFGDHTRAFKYVEQSFVLGADGAKVLEPIAQLDKKFLFYYLKTLRIESAGYSRHYKFLKESFIPVPPLDEQKRIVAILDKADVLRSKRQQTIKLAEQFIRSVFLDIFGDPVVNPKKLPKKTLGELIKVSSGSGLTAKNMVVGGKYPVYGGNGVAGYHDSYMFDEPKIIIGRVGAYCGVVHVTSEKSWVTDNALYLKEISDSVQPCYLEFALKMANLNQYAGRAAQPLISGSRIYPVEIMCPPLDLQSKFMNVVDCFNVLDKFSVKSEDEIEKFFSSLTQKSFSGQL